MDGPGTAAAAADPSSALASADAAGSPAGCGGDGRRTVEPGHPGVETATAAADGGDDAVGTEGTGPFASPPPPPPLPSAADATASHEDHPYDTHPNGSGLEHKTGKIKQIVEDAISPESKQMVMKILEQVNQLSMIEKLYLYLKLPTGKTTPVDPLRQHLNPLGSRFEIQQTITWIKTHLEEDPEVSLPKQDVYDEYLAYCSQNKMKHLSNADFGKVMKQVFPCVRPRRLGTRGNSRYCYSGMRKRMKLHAPLLPDLGERKLSSPHSEDEVVSAASSLIREWAEKLLSVRFDSLRDLAYHLVEKMCVDSRSVAAFTLLSVNSAKCNGKEVTPPLGLPSGHLGATNRHMEAQMQLQRKLKEREMIREQKRKMQDQQQLQHQQLHHHHNSSALGKVSAFEKLKPSKRAKVAHFKERRGMSSAASTQSDVASGLFAGEQWDAIKFEDCATTKAPSLGRRGKSASVDSIATTSDSLQLRQVMTASVPVVSCGEPKENEDIFVPVQQISNVLPLPSSTSIQDKLPIPRMVNNNNNSRANSKPLVSAHKPDIIMPNQKLSLVVRKKFYKPIQPKPDKQKLTSKDCNETYDAGIRNSLPEEQSNRTEEITTNTVKVEIDSGQHIEENVNHENDPLCDYFHGGHNSQEQEEELVRYFQHQTSSSSTEELEEVLMPCRSATADPTKSDQLSQLRLLLERNLTNATAARNLNARQASVPSCPVATSMGQILTEDSGANDDVFLPGPGLTIPAGASASVSLSLLSQRNQQKQQHQQQQQRQSTQPLPMLQVNEPKPGLIPSLLSNSSNNSGLSVRRRVSFETSVTEHYQSDNCFQHAVPPSPNTRRKFFNFTPISAGPHSPLGQRPSAPSSKPSSANASPFVSPRNTPVPRNRHISSFPSMQQSSQLSGRLRIPSKVVRSNSVTGGLHTTPFPLTRPRPLSTTTPLLHSDNSQLPLQPKGSQNTMEPQVLVNNQHTNVLSLSLASASPMSLSAPHSPMISASSITSSVTCSAEEAPEYMNSDLLISKMLNQEKMSQQFNNGVDSNFFPSAVGSNLHVQQMLTPAKQINRLQNVAQPSQIPPLPTPDPLAHEVSQFFSDDVGDRSRHAVQQQFQYRSQSVPLHRMLSTSDLISPHYTVPHSVDSNLQMNQFSLSATSSVAPTPVPSECMDFTSVTDNSSAGQGVNLLIDETDPETATLNSENLDRIFNILDDVQEQDKQLQQLQQQQEELQQQNESDQQQQCQRLLLKHQEPLGKEHQHPHQQIGLTLDLVAADNVNGDFLDLPCSQTRSGMHSSRSYPNTPVPHKCTNVRDPLVTSLCMPSSNLDNSPSTLGSRSLPPTPLLSILDDEVTPFQSIVDRDPMLTLNALNSRLSEEGNNYVARRNMHSLLEESLTLDALDLQECDSFSQLTEVETAVHDT